MANKLGGEQMTDDELKERLHECADEHGGRFNSWEADFIEDMMRRESAYTDNQRAKIEQILREYR